MMYYASFAFLIVTTTVYICYQRFLHPLARFPGPFWATFTELWNVREWISGEQPYRLTTLHEKYGPIVRNGPNRLSITSSDGVNTIYVKGFKTMPKTEFYDAFGSTSNPNLFNQRDPEAHGIERRIILKAFSPQAVEKYEEVINVHLQRLRTTIRGFSETGDTFDLKRLIYLFMCDVIAALVYGQNFDIQRTGQKQKLPDDHRIARYGAALGACPSVHLFLMPILFLTPHPQAGFMRNTLSYLLEAFSFAKSRREELKNGIDIHRKDLITHMLSTDLNGNKSLSESKVNIELFGFIFAGVHPPAASMDMLFWHLLHNPKTLQQAVAEIDENLPRMTANREAYSTAEVERHLPYLRSCIKESFRITPAFTMPLPRRVVSGDTYLDGQRIPRGTTVAMCNHAFHHNAEVWGNDHNVFDPSRWDKESNKELSKLLMHFGAGGRQCIGKTLATSIIYKLTSSLLSEFSLRLAVADEQSKALAGDFLGKLPELESVGISDLRDPLFTLAVNRYST